MTEGIEGENEERRISTGVNESEAIDVEQSRSEESVNFEDQLDHEADILQNQQGDGLSEADSPENEGEEDDDDDDDEDEEDRAEDGDCPFCDYMKLGPCGKNFSAWEACTEAAEKVGGNVFEKCNAITGVLTACMKENLGYYGPVFEAQNGLDGPLLEAEAKVKLERNADKNSKFTKDEQEGSVQDSHGKS